MPSLVAGPALTAHNNTAEGFTAEIMKGKFPGIPNPDVQFAAVDVRDAALGHCLALFKPNLDGQRIALTGGSVYLS